MCVGEVVGCVCGSVWLVVGVCLLLFGVMCYCGLVSLDFIVWYFFCGVEVVVLVGVLVIVFGLDDLL